MSRRPRTTHVRRFALGLSLLLLAGAIAFPASAEEPDNKSYTAAITPDVACAGTGAFTLTFENTSSQQQLGSAQIAAVTEGFVFTGAEPPVVDPAAKQKGKPVAPSAEVLDGGVLELGDLDAAPGAIVTVAFTATVDVGTNDFTTRAKQANDFNSANDDANTLVLFGDEPSITASDCQLAFLTQPGDSVVGEDVPGKTDTSPQVQIVDGDGAPVALSDLDVTIGIGNDPSTEASAVLSGTTTVATVAGVATFGDLRIDTAGQGYTLSASATGFDDEKSDPFNVYEAGTTCLGGSDCVLLLGKGTDLESTSTGTAIVGTTGSLFGVAAPKTDQADDRCGDVEYDPETYSYLPSDVTVAGFELENKTIVFKVSKAADQQQVNNGVSFYQICAEPTEPFSEYSTFIDIFGNQVISPFDDVNGVGDGRQPEGTVASGFLPDCSATGDVAPCVESRTKQGGGPLITVRWGSGFRFG